MNIKCVFGISAVMYLFLGSVYAQPWQTEVPPDYDYIVKPGQQVPEFELELPDGSATSIGDLRGKVVMLQFTASWCGVCRKEMPHIESEIWQKYKGNPGFALYGIDLKEPAATVTEFRRQTGVTYPIALDLEGAIFSRFAAPGAGVTRNVIIDRNGRIVFMTRLYKTEEFNQMKRVIGELLADISGQ